MNSEQPTVRIISAPFGEPPDWVRDAWVGLELPLSWPAVKNVRTFGVLSGPKSLFSNFLYLISGRGEKQSGYIVKYADAIKVLRESRPDAALWWDQNVGKGKSWSTLLFQASCGELRQMETVAVPRWRRIISNVLSLLIFIVLAISTTQLGQSGGSWLWLFPIAWIWTCFGLLSNFLLQTDFWRFKILRNDERFLLITVLVMMFILGAFMGVFFCFGRLIR